MAWTATPRKRVQTPVVVRGSLSDKYFWEGMNPFISQKNVLNSIRGCPRGVMVKVTDCRIVVSEFVLQSRYYVHFWTNRLGKGMNPLILPSMG